MSVSVLEKRVGRLEQRVIQFDEMQAFWGTRRIGHDRWEDVCDEELHGIEFPDLPQRIINLLGRTGFSCRRQVAACPDWLMATIPNMGKKSLLEIRAAIPFLGPHYYRESCPRDEAFKRRLREQAGG